MGDADDQSYFADVPDLKVTDIVEIIIIAVIVYEIALWIKNTKAWMLLRGIVVLAFLFPLLPYSG